LFASLVLLTAAAKRKEKKPIKTGTSNGHITNLKKFILETFDTNGGDWIRTLNLGTRGT
jgi:hypothetical protein